MGTPSKFTTEQVEKAHQLFLRYTPWHTITDITGLPHNNIKKYANDHWRAERNALKSELIEAALESKRGLLLSIAKHGLEIIEKGMKDLASSNRPMTPKELQSIAGIIDNFDKIVKLDDGQATERTEIVQPASIIELKKLINDPFMSIDDATYKELPEEKDEKKDS